ncbi:MAG: 3'-5' exonuclease, partial [Terrimicrobiaceae bacterium]
MKFTDNQQLFGFDPTENIVAVEFSEPNLAEVYVREADGSTAVRREEFSPYFWNTATGEPLAGDASLNHLVKASDWLSFQSGRAELQKSGAVFAINDPVQQYLTSSGRTLFKGMAFEDLRRLQVDIETASTEGFEFSSAERDAVTAIAVSDSSGWEEIVVIENGSAESERSALEWLTRTIQERDPDVIEGHNLFKFDLPYLTARAKKLKVRLAWGRDGSPLKSRPSRLQIAEKTIQYPKFAVRGRHIA